MLARKIATPKRSSTPVARCCCWFVKKARRDRRWRLRTLSRSCWFFWSFTIWAFMALSVGSLSGSTIMIWTCAMMRVMQATREKMPETHATTFATWAPSAAASEGCFRLLSGAPTAGPLRHLGLELQHHRSRPHGPHRHAGDLAVRAPGAAVAVAPVRFVVRPLPPDGQRQELARDDEADEGPEDARAVADLVL